MMWLHHENEDIRNKWKIFSTFTDIVVTYFVLVNIQLGSKKLYRNDKELASNQSYLIRALKVANIAFSR